jgi:hypothetical protein
VLVLGAILAPRQRRVTAVLRVMGLRAERQYQNYPRVLNRARWSSLQVSRILLGLLVVAFVPSNAPIIVAADETLERRRGKRIAATGHFRDAVLSSESPSVASEGLRWVSLLLLVKIAWSSRMWALPFLTLLAPHQKTNRALGKRHKTSIDWVGQMIAQVRRWLPQRNAVNFTRRLEHNIDLYEAGEISFAELDASMQGWINHVRYADTWGLRGHIFDSHPIKLHPEPETPRPPKRVYRRKKR